MNLLALTKYGPKAASTRQRLLQFAPALEKKGVSIHLEPLLSDAYLDRLYDGRSVRGEALCGLAQRLSVLVKRLPFDLAWINYEAFPFGGGLYERLLSRKIPYVLDLDDAFFLQQRDSIFPWERRRLSCVAYHASGVTVGNEYLASAIRPFQSRVAIFPTVVDESKFLGRQKPGVASSLVLGWMGSPSTASYLLPLEPVLKEWCGRGHRFIHIGSGRQFRDFVGEQREWGEEREALDLGDIQIGIMPLPDSEWALGKCSFKLIQYMMAGAAVVATPVGMNKEVVIPEVGFMATSLEEWRLALKQFEANQDLWKKMGCAGRERAKALYSLQSIENSWVDFLLGSIRSS